MKDEVCIVTGSGNGIGREAALQLALEKGKIVVSDLDLLKAEQVVAEIVRLATFCVWIRVLTLSTD